MSVIKRAALAVALGLASLTAIASAAQPVRVEILSVQEDAGRITATVVVYGPDGVPVSRLAAANISASLDGASIGVNGVQSTQSARQPLSIVLAVDVSGSMYGDPITQARKALTEFVGALEPGDEVALLAFDTNVKVLQDFTSDQNQAGQAVSRLAPLGDTALYDAVTAAAAKASEAQTERKLVILLTDGVATVNVDRRQTSLDAARASGVSFVAIGLGATIDRAYLNELAASTGGRFLEAPTPAALRDAYSKLAAAIKTQHTITFAVPPGVDRTVSAKLVVRVSVAGENAVAERILPPLGGAAPPPFQLELSGLAAGVKVKEPVSIQPVIPSGLSGVTLEYFIDGESVYTGPVDQPFELDPASLSDGNHLLKAVAIDSRGRRGEKQITFASSAPGASGGFSVPVVPIVVALAALAVAAVVLRRRRPATSEFASRIKPWMGRSPDAVVPIASPSVDWEARERPRAAAMAPAAPRALGRVIVMDELAVRSGNLDAIREYEIGTSPLTLGTTDGCDIVIQDPEGRIAGEEARLWVQRGRLVYHKLTTLSAMATEGVTSGWHFLDSGEELRVGPCRMSFQLDVLPEPEAQAAVAPSPRLRELWPSNDAEPLGAPSD